MFWNLLKKTKPIHPLNERTEPPPPPSLPSAKNWFSQGTALLTAVTQSSLVLSAITTETGDTWSDGIAYLLSAFFFISMYCTAYKLAFLYFSKKDKAIMMQSNIDNVRKKSGIPGSVAKAWAGAASLNRYLTRSSVETNTSAGIAYTLMVFSTMTQIALLWSKYTPPPPLINPTQQQKAGNLLKFIAGHLCTLAFAIPNIFLFIMTLLNAPNVLFDNDHQDTISSNQDSLNTTLFYLIHAICISGSLPVVVNYGALTSNMLKYSPSSSQAVSNILRKLTSPISVIAGSCGGIVATTGILRKMDVPYEASLTPGIIIGLLGFAPYSFFSFAQSLLEPKPSEKMTEMAIKPPSLP